MDLLKWNKLMEELLEEGGTVCLLGQSDTGKSTFAKLLISKALKRGIKVGWVDADIGQSTIGPPTTIGLAFPDQSTEDIQNIKVSRLYFVGSTNPRGHLLPLIVGTQKMVELARGNSDLVIVDTTGTVSGDFGHALKYNKVIAIRPDFLVLFPVASELEPLASLFENLDIFKIRRAIIPPEIRVRSRQERINYRQAKFQKYFQQAIKYRLFKEDLSFYPYLENLPGKIIPKNLLVGLKDKSNELIALGIVVEEYEDSIKVLAPFLDPQKVRHVELGSIRIDKEGNQIG